MSLKPRHLEAGLGKRAATCLLCFGLLFTAGCVRGCTSTRPPIHVNPNMDNQPKYLPQSSSEFFYNGAAMRVPVEGTVARGDLREDSTIYTGLQRDGTFAANPLEVNDELLERGRERYEIYCTPCHGSSGDGQGMLQTRAGVQTSNLHDDRIKQMPDGQLFDVISRGFGLMPPYDYLIVPRDRWAIVTHIRRLQSASQTLNEPVEIEIDLDSGGPDPPEN